MKKIAIILLIILQFLFIQNVFAQTLEITNGIAYLTSTQNPDGSWGETDESINTDFYSTAVCVETLNVLVETNAQAYINGVQWLGSYPIENAGYIASRISAISGENFDLSADLDLLLQWQNEDMGWGGYLQFTSSNFHTTLALQALKAVNHPDLETISYALGYLISTQNEDGGFGFSSEDDASAGSAQSSNVYMTALVLKTFNVFSSTFNVQSSIDMAVAYLLTMQNPDGGFPSAGSGQDPSTVYTTALAFDALVTSGADPSTGSGQVFQNAIDYLITSQLADGSWEQDPYSTALAIRALASLKPNLTVSSDEISYIPSVPTSGNTVTITATVINIGIADAPSTGSGYITVGFYDGDPDSGVLIGEAVIPDIPQGGSGVASINWTPTTADIHNIFVLVDPQDTIAESNETDNLGVIQIRIYEEVDLLIEGITLIPGLPAPGQTVEAQVKVTNRGDFPTSNVVVRVSLDAIAIGDSVIPTLESMQSAVVTFSLQNLTAGIHQITAAVDPDNLIIESNETNV